MSLDEGAGAGEAGGARRLVAQPSVIREFRSHAVGNGFKIEHVVR